MPDSLREAPRPAPPRRAAWAAARAIWSHLPSAQHRRLWWTLALMLVGAVAEMATVGAVIPFLAAIVPAAPTGRTAQLVGPLARWSAATGLSRVAIAAGLLVLVAAASAVLRLVLVRVSQAAVFTVAHELAIQVYHRALHQPYSFHIARNTSETLAGVEKVQFVLGNVLMPAMLGATAGVVALFVLAALLAVDPLTSLAAFACFAALYAATAALTRPQLYRNSRVIARAMQGRVQALQEGLGGIRDVLLDRSQAVFVDRFAALDDQFRQAQAANQFAAAAPRFVVEGASVVLVAALALFESGRPGGLVGALPTLGALALGAQRLLPLVQQVYFSWSQIFGNRAVLDDVAGLLELPDALPDDPRALPPFGDAITLRRVSFAYPAGARPALDGIDLTVPKGMRLGVVGASGSGKSTLADLIMGLLEPSSGAVEVDGRAIDDRTRGAWRRQVAHVPQAIFLMDGTVAGNIAFGRTPDEIDMARVEAAARGANLHDFIIGLPAGYDSPVGERGVRLSGGQRQRVGIARALYKGAAVLVLDEATSALDDETEAAVIDAIAGLSRELTVISIAHRVTTLKSCDIVLRLRDGRIDAIGDYRAVIGGVSAT